MVRTLLSFYKMNSQDSDIAGQSQDAEGATPAKRPMTNGDLTKRQTILNTQLVRMICQDLHSYDIVDYTGFRNFSENLDPNYTLPTKQAVIDKLIPNEYNKEKHRLQETLTSVDDLAVSIEVWRVVKDQGGYTKVWTLTIHYIYQDQNISQNLFTLEEKTRVPELAGEIREALNDWQILEKVVCFVIQKGHENKPNLQLKVTKELEKPHVFCAASVLNLVVHDGLHYIYVNKEYQKKYSQLSKLKKNVEYVFSWHQHYTELKQLQLNPQADGEDYRNLDECLQILKYIEEVTNILSNTRYTTLSRLLNLIDELKCQVTRCTATSDEVKEFKHIIMTAIESHFERSDHNLAEKAYFMDPRYNHRPINFSNIDFGCQTIANELYQRVMSRKHTLLQTSSMPNILEELPLEPLSPPNVTDDQMARRGFLNTKQLLNFLNEKERTREVKMVFYYKNLFIQDSVQNIDPFTFWKRFRSSYLKGNPDSTVSEFYKMSQKYLCIPATAVPVETIPGEYLWAKTPNEKLYNLRRVRLPDKKISEILFLHSYYSRN